MGRKTFYIFLFSATCHAVIFPANRISPRNSPGEEVIGYRVVTPQQIQQELSERPRLGFEELQVERQSPPPEYSAEDVRRNNQRRNIFVKTRIPEVLHFAEDAEQMEAVNQFIQESDEINMHYRVLNIEPFIDTLATLANNTKKKLYECFV